MTDTNQIFGMDQDQDMNTQSGLIAAKIVAMVTLGFVTCLVGILPLKLSKYINLSTQNSQNNNFYISLLLCFGGGVLLFTTFIHLQPEVRESFEKLQESNILPNDGTPIAELVFCGGFFFVYFIEEIVHLCLERRGQHNHDEDDALQRSISLRRCSQVRVNSEISRTQSMRANTIENGHIGNGKISSIKTDLAKSNHSHSHFVQTHDNLKGSFHSLLTVLALSFHAVFEGLAVGLENDSTRVLYLFAAISTHKFVIAFCVGVELLNSKIKLPLFLSCIATFAIVTPLGIGIGILLSASGAPNPEESLLPTILQGMAAGTLLYVVFFEVLSREKNNDHEGLWQLLAIILGFTIMYLIQSATGHEHSHEHGHDHDETTEKIATILNEITTAAHA